MPIRSITCFFILFSLCTVFAKDLGPDISVYDGEELKWEDGAYGYHVMFKSLLELNTESSNIICKDETVGSTYSLDPSHIPTDALVERAFLIWSGAVPFAEIGEPTDSEVTLSFISEDGKITEDQTITGKKAYKVSEAEGFEFDAFTATDDPTHSYFTYRVDITDFFKSIHDKGRELGLEFDGYSLYGNYTMKDLKCASDESYLNSTSMVSGWSIIMIYISKEISPKKIYLYDGFKAYWYEENEINVTGFEFPTDPEVRITLATHEGDPNLVSVYENDDVTLAGPEGMQVQGDNLNWLLMYNDCNPEAYKTDGMTQINYIETFNSVSSVYGWADTEPTCIGGIPPVWEYGKIEYAMDVDTFVMDSEIVGEYAAHFNKGGMYLNLRIGANQDSIITNFMIVSVDTKHPTFDIPDQPELVACTPANIPVDPENPDSKWCDNGLPHTFAIRIQNWGDDVMPLISVKNSIPVGMEYVAGSTEYATEFTTVKDKKVAKQWIKIPDNAGVFPLIDGFKVADNMDFCGADSDYLVCEDLVMVRFRARVKDETQKNAVIENVASIDTTGFPTYKTNLGLPVKLKLATTGCVSNPAMIDFSDCGGTKGPETCTDDSDCDEDLCCYKKEGELEGFCQVTPCSPRPLTCRNDYSVSTGNRNLSDDVIFITSVLNLVMGEIIVLPSISDSCTLKFQKFDVNVKLDDEFVEINNPKLYFDKNNNGVVDYTASQESPFAYGKFNKEKGLIEFYTFSSNYFDARYLNSILLVADIGYKDGENISKTASFTPSIQTGGITIVDDGEPEITGLPVSFSKFQIPPDDTFVITKGESDYILSGDLYHGEYESADILQFKAFSKGSDDRIKSITFTIPEESNAEFGDEISFLSLYLDSDKNGFGDEEIIRTEKTDAGKSHKFLLDIPVTDSVPKYFTVKSDIDLFNGDHFQIQISDIEIESDKEILGLPVNSKEYSYTCDPAYEDCHRFGTHSCFIPFIGCSALIL
ncbi:MAG TPA: hypothetical protein PLZ43_11495 [bacterium]|nr:hypothetical protein [bacterium]